MHGNARSMPRVVILSTHSYIGTSGLSTIRFGSYQFHFVPCLPEPLEKGMLEDMSAVVNHVQEDLSSPDEPSCRQTAPRQEPPPYRMRRPASFSQARAPGSALSGFCAYTVECRLATPPPHDGMGSRARCIGHAASHFLKSPAAWHIPIFWNHFRGLFHLFVRGVRAL